MNSMAAFTTGGMRPTSLWREVVCPKEHGSWSLALEPVALGLLVAPSAAGACLGVSLTAAFLARRPLRLALLERRPERRTAARQALAWCIAAAAVGCGGAVALAGISWGVWLAPATVAAAAFAFCDARGDGREELAELAGATAFALTPIAFAILGELGRESAVALGLLMLARAAPSVATVRAFLRGAKTGVRRDGFALFATGAALLLGLALALRGLAPWFAVGVLGVFALRTLALLVVFRPAWRARNVGMLEAALGVVFVIGLAVTWAR